MFFLFPTSINESSALEVEVLDIEVQQRTFELEEKTADTIFFCLILASGCVIKYKLFSILHLDKRPVSLIMFYDQVINCFHIVTILIVILRFFLHPLRDIITEYGCYYVQFVPRFTVVCQTYNSFALGTGQRAISANQSAPFELSTNQIAPFGWGIQTWPVLSALGRYTLVKHPEKVRKFGMKRLVRGFIGAAFALSILHTGASADVGQIGNSLSKG